MQLVIQEGSITSNDAYPNLVICKIPLSLQRFGRDDTKLDPAVYPCFELYPRKAADVVRYEIGSNLQICVNFTGFYPNITICEHVSMPYVADNTEDCCIDPPAYPNFELYPALVVSEGGADSDMSSSGPAVCIHLLIYSSVTNQSTSQASENLAESEITLQVYRCQSHPFTVLGTLC